METLIPVDPAGHRHLHPGLHLTRDHLHRVRAVDDIVLDRIVHRVAEEAATLLVEVRQAGLPLTLLVEVLHQVVGLVIPQAEAHQVVVEEVLLAQDPVVDLLLVVAVGLLQEAVAQGVVVVLLLGPVEATSIS